MPSAAFQKQKNLLFNIKDTVVDFSKLVIHWFESALIRILSPNRILPLQIDITNACNLNCIHCYHSDHKNMTPMTLDQIIQILSEYKSLTKELNYKREIVLCGGEPLLNRKIWNILDQINSILGETRVVILTNGTLLDEGMISNFKKYASIEFQVSLDGANAIDHDFFRGTGNFKKSIEGIGLLQANGFSVQLLGILSKRTSENLEDFFNLAKSLGIKSINFTRLILSGSARKSHTANLDSPLKPLELRESFQRIIHYKRKYGMTTKVNSPLFELLIPGLGRSGFFSEGLVIDYQGYFKASSRIPLRLDHIDRIGLREFYLSNEVLNNIRIGKIKGCGGCQFIHTCGGDRNAAFAESGDFLGPDPGCWLKLKRPEQDRPISLGFSPAGPGTGFK